MSNLSDLLPAGASAKQITATDSGSGIASKAPVVMSASGTVTEVGLTAQSASFGSTADFDTDRAYYPAVVHDTASGNDVVFYRDAGNNSYLTARVVSVSGSTLTFGTAVVGNTVHADYISATYDASQNKILVSYRDDTYGRIRAVVGTVSGTSISFGSAALIGSYQGYRTKVAYNAAANASLIAFSYGEGGGYSNYPYGCVATISGTSVSFGTLVRIESTGAEMSWNTNVYDVASTKNLVAYRSGSGARASVATISGTSVSFGTHVDWTTDTTDYLAGVYDPTTSKTAIFYRNNSQSYYLYYVVGTVSGTSVSFGSQAAAESSGNDYDISASFDTSVNKHIISFTLDGGADQYRWLIEGTMSGTTMSFTTKVSADNGNNAQYDAAQCYDPVAEKSILAITDNTTTTAYMRTYTASGSVPNLTAQAFVGVADSAISASAAGSIIVQGGTVSGVSLPEALTFGTASVFESANAIDICAAFDSSNNRVVFAYKDSGNSPGQGTAVVATLSGTSLTYGTPVVFETDETREPSIAFDSNENKIVIAYREDNAPSYLGKSVVGTVDPSDNSITFGTAVQFSAANAYNTTTVFDSNSNRIVIGYRDTSNSNKGTAVVGTVSGTSITYGTPVVYDSGAVQNYGGGGFDSTSNQAVFCYVVGADEKCILGAVDPSDNSITYGAATTIASNGTGFRSVSFDSTNNRVVETFSDGSTGKTMCAVGTVSGTSISFGTPVVAESSVYAGYVGSAFDVSSGRMVIVVNTASSGYGFTGAVSGTTITVDSSTVTFLSGDPNYVNAVYESNANKVVVSYGDATNSNYGTGVVATYGTVPLTTGTKYFVAPTGGFSSTAGSPSVNAGLAISTTSLLLNGDS